MSNDPFNSLPFVRTFGDHERGYGSGSPSLTNKMIPLAHLLNDGFTDIQPCLNTTSLSPYPLPMIHTRQELDTTRENHSEDTSMPDLTSRRHSRTSSAETVRAPTGSFAYPAPAHFSMASQQRPASEHVDMPAYERNYSADLADASSVASSTDSCAELFAQAQRSYFELVSDICTEAARRTWQSDVQSRLTASFDAMRRRRLAGGHTSHHKRARFGSNAIHNRSATAAESHTASLCFMDYVSMLANSLWEKARLDERDVHKAEATAAEDMNILYSIANKIVGVLEAAGHGHVFGFEELKDVAFEARGLCRFLNYKEGAARCEEMVKGWEATA